MKIGELSKLSGVSASGIRYYERHGLLPQSRRQENGYRSYDEGVLERLRIISLCKALGFSLSEIRVALADTPTEDLSCTEIVVHLKDKLAAVRKHIVDLQCKEVSLEKLLYYFEHEKPEGEHASIGQLFEDGVV